MAARETAIAAVLDAIDILMDGPYVRAQVGDAGLWTGSANQRVIDLPATRQADHVILIAPELSSGDGDAGRQ